MVKQLKTLADRSRIWIEARSDLHSIQGETVAIDGEAEVAFSESGFDLRVAPRGRLRVPRLDRLPWDEYRLHRPRPLRGAVQRHHMGAGALRLCIQNPRSTHGT